MKSNNICLLHYTCPPIIGGVETVLAAHARLFVESGYGVKVLAGRGGPFHPEIDVKIIPEIDSKNRALLAINEELDKGVVGERFGQMQARIAGLLAEELASVDVCFVHNAFTLHKNLPLTAALHQLAGAEGSPRFVAWCHDVSWTNPLYLPALRDAPPWNLLKKPLPGVTYVTVSQERAQQLGDIFQPATTRIQVIPNGVDPNSFLRLSPVTQRLVDRFRLLDQDIILLLPSRITRRKNIEFAIAVVRALEDRHVSAKLIVTGPPGPHNIRSDEYLHLLQRRRMDLALEDRVIFLCEEKDSRGEPVEVTDTMMSELYLLGDAMIFPSAQEGFGIPLLEAGLSRLPIFCSDIRPFREIGEGLAHFFSLDDAPTEVAAEIDNYLRKEPAYRFRRHVLRRYTWPAIFQHFIEPLLTLKV
ncbi:MAG: glycosyltransferase family 4 protein [Chloroflexi bacterium]|nr:glycosyltransferase family 4 protein [Chloroflexota bacterium]